MATENSTRINTNNNNNVLTSPTLSVKRIRGNGSTPSQPKCNTSSIVKRRLALSPLSQTEVNNRSFFTSSPRLDKDNSHETNKKKNNLSPLHTTTTSNSTIPQDYFHQNNEQLNQGKKSNGNDSSIDRTDHSLNDHGLDESNERIQSSEVSFDANIISTDFNDNITKRKRSTFSRNVQEEHSELPIFGDNDTSVETIPPNNSSSDKEETCVIDFQYPTIPFPSKKILRHCYDLSMKNENKKFTVSLVNQQLIPNFLNLSHQQQLKLYGCNLISLEDVIIPSIAKCHNHELIKYQSKSQREDKEKNLSNTSVIKLCRVVIQTSAVQAIKAIREYRLSWEKDQDLKFLQSLREEREKRKQMRQKRRELKAQRRKEKIESRKREKENRFRQRKKNWGKNKELWVEVATLMTNLGTLRKEEKLWRDASDNINLNQIATMPIVTDVFGENDPNGEDQVSELPSIDQPIINSVADISLAANRINDALGAVVQLMEQSDSIKNEVYNKYGKHHKFHGYRAVKNPKALIRALALC